MFKEQKGITLVALVITIIVLLILAGVSISLVMGDNGILTQAQTAVSKNQIATVKEKVSTSFAAVDVAYYAKWTSNQAITRTIAYKDTVDGIIAELGKNGLVTTGTVATNDPSVTTAASVDTTNGYVGTAAPLVVIYENVAYNFGDVKVDENSGALTFVNNSVVITEPGKAPRTLDF